MSARKRKPGLYMATANRLVDGEVVFLAADGTWAEDVAAGAAIDEKAADDSLAVAERSADACVVVGPYLIEITRGADGTLWPTLYREQLRALGPSVRTDLGKQAGPSSKRIISDVPL
jgi:Protein of unknown function (DUF2849)